MAKHMFNGQAMGDLLELGGHCQLASRTSGMKRRKNVGHRSRLTIPIVLEMSYVTPVGGRSRCIEGLQNAGQGNQCLGCVPNVSAPA